ncbi:putative ABC transporter ATP-binding protein YxlF [Paenibacillus plantiphilus]|uniref:ABC transporter ATP-binding protein YxlF n=1 Tax=Paenibacillus plantiphilus TaxID=2905650 RepID=A0ABN8GBN0_9BACL|nr:ABC transporter ATP-binding protein [Paenibacillus plantiphilus]CAH1205108.1 putative ABC transporter ATP-binding protein YxlF [Paenibacillus plantiphilus]
MALLTVKGLTKSFESTQAVNSIGFTIHEGRCVALLGPNGAGKTTAIRMLTGLIAPTSGDIEFHGIGPGADRRSLIGFLPQVPAFYNWMTGREFLIYAGRLCGLSAKEAQTRSSELLERVGIASAAKRRIAGYSGGMKQRLGLAQALIHRPKLLILDEPVSALDPIGRREVMELLRSLKLETTVLFSTHVLHDAEELCDDVLIMRAGRIAVGGSIQDIRSEHRQPILSLEIEQDEHSRKWLQNWLKTPPAYVKTYSALSGGVRLVVDDVNAARRNLLAELVESDVRMTKLEIGHTTLEDLFMKAVTE